MDAESRIEESHPAAGSALPITIRRGSGPICSMAQPLDAEWENGVAAPEPRRRCTWLHHGSDPRRDPPHARLWCDVRARMAGSSLIVHS
jgi:hypothetical protein